jgi:hypothetical protein
MPRWRRRLGVVVTVTGVLLIPSARAAGECVHAVVYVTREGEPPVWVAGEQDPCLTPTPWYQEIVFPSDSHNDGMPTGAPNGYFVDLRVPVP